jgi:hypothetical protein
VVLWTLTVLALLSALASVLLVRRQGRRLDALTQSYWELRYDYTRLRSQVARLDPAEAPAPEPVAAAPPPSMTFVPLSSMRKKDP